MPTIFCDLGLGSASCTATAAIDLSRTPPVAMAENASLLDAFTLDESFASSPAGMALGYAAAQAASGGAAAAAIAPGHVTMEEGESLLSLACSAGVSYIANILSVIFLVYQT